MMVPSVQNAAIVQMVQMGMDQMQMVEMVRKVLPACSRVQARLLAAQTKEVGEQLALEDMADMPLQPSDLPEEGETALALITKKPHKERMHSNEILDNFELEPEGTGGSEAGTARVEQQLALIEENKPSNIAPAAAPQHVIEHPELDDDMITDDKDMLGRWDNQNRELSTKGVDRIKPDEMVATMRQNPAIPRYVPPGAPSASLWNQRQRGLNTPAAPKALPLNPSLRTAHQHVRDPRNPHQMKKNVAPTSPHSPSLQGAAFGARQRTTSHGESSHHTRSGSPPHHTSTRGSHQ